MKTLILTAAAAATLVAGIAPAFAQYYGGDDYGPPRRRYERSYGEEYRGDYGGPRYGRPGYGPPPDRRLSRVCVTSRGTCPSYPAPIASPCRCDIPGFGPKRGAIGGY